MGYCKVFLDKKLKELRKGMKRQEYQQSSIPEDVAINIVSCLKVSDVCSLGSCSRFWREICGSGFVWKSFCKERWPELDLNEEISASQRESNGLDQEKDSKFKGWKECYIKKHNEMTGKVAFFGECLSCEPVDVKIYLKFIEEMNSMQFGFKDVLIHFLKPDINVLLNLIGLHYCSRHLGMQVDTLKDVVSRCKIQERLISVEWCKRGWWTHRLQVPNELHFHCVSLGDLTTTEGEDVLEVLDRGITHEVVQVQISTAKRQNEKHCHLSFSQNLS